MKQKINEMQADKFFRGSKKLIKLILNRLIWKRRRCKSSGISGMSGGYKRSSENEKNNEDVALKTWVCSW